MRYLSVTSVLSLLLLHLTAPEIAHGEPSLKIHPENLIENAGFERFSDEGIAGWGPPVRDEKFVIEIDREMEHSGKSSLKIDWLKDSPESGSFWFCPEKKFPIEANRQYHLSLWLKKSRPEQTFFLRIYAFDEKDDRVFRSSGWHSPAESTGWQRWAFNNLMYTERKILTVRILALFGRGRRTVWLDDLKFAKMEDDSFPLNEKGTQSLYCKLL